MTDPLALAAMVAHCGWDPTEVVTNRTILIDGNGTALLTLPSLHVTGVSAVSITDQWGTVVTLASTDSPATIGPGLTQLSWSENGCLIYKGCQFGRVFPADQQNIAVTYSGGYSTIPADLQAALDSIGKRTAPMSAGHQAKKMGSAEFIYSKTATAGNLLLVEELVLNKYRILKSR